MEKVQGIGGVFIYAEDAKSLSEWYKKHLGLKLMEYGGSSFVELPSADIEPGNRRSTTTFAIFQSEEKGATAKKTARINWRTPDLAALLASLKEAGVFIEEKDEKSDYGWFAYAHDPEGNRLELWQPPLASDT